MPKKAPGERWRYIAFIIDGALIVARNDFLDSLMKASRGTSLQNSFRITVFENNFGILKVPHTLKEEAIRVLTGMDHVGPSTCSVRTLKTSGTIKTLKDEYRDRFEASGFDE